MPVKGIMLIEKWERFRGINRWPEVDATVTDKKWRYSYSRDGVPHRHVASIVVNYRSDDGVLRSKKIRYWGTCDLDVGDLFYIRCSPKDPSKIYVRESAQQKFILLAGVAILALAIWLKGRYR